MRLWFFDSAMKRSAWSMLIGSSPKVCILVSAKCSQLQMRCRAVSCSSSSQNLQNGAVVKSIMFWKWFSLLWPVISLISGLSSSEFKLNRYWP